MTAPEPDTLTALFVGNSFTARNDVPGLVARLAAARGRRVEPQLVWAGGASLRLHWNRGDARREIEGTRRDWVVLQEQSTLPVKNPARMRENVRLFDEVVRASGARTALYVTWARRHAPETQAAITRAYEEIGAELGALVVPVGAAWERVLAAPGHPELHDADGSHPSPAGSYLAACVFLAALVGESPVGLDGTAAGVDDAAVALLQESAAAAVAAPRRG